MQYFLMALVAIGRLIPHPWNFTPTGAIGLFAGSQMSLGKAIFVPLVPVIIADAIIGFYTWHEMAAVYIGMLMAVVIGKYLIAGKEKPLNIAGGVGLSALAFFLISNFGIWVSGYYGYSFAGLIACYVAGLPFLGASLLGDSVYAVALFGGKALIVNMKRDESDIPAGTA